MNKRVCATLQKPFSSLAAEFMNASEANAAAGDLGVKNREKQKGCSKVIFAYWVLTLMRDVEKVSEKRELSLFVIISTRLLFILLCLSFCPNPSLTLNDHLPFNSYTPPKTIFTK